LVPFSKTKINVRLTSTAFYDEDGDEKRKKIFDYNYDYYSDSDYYSNFNLNNLIREEQVDNDKIDNDKIYNDKIDNDNLYTLVWFDCEDCRKLLIDIKNDNKKILYIDGGYYFFDENDETNTPIFYKNDELIATDVFSIYEELFFNKIIGE
jgi:hypothetical protein